MFSTGTPTRASRDETESTDSLDIYLREATSDYTGPMARDEESRLALAAQGGCDVSLERLVRAHSRFVVLVAKRYQHRGLPLPDLIQEGNIGMIRGIRKFDPTRGVKLISYAVWWIRQAIQDAIAEQGRNVRVGRNRDAELNRLRRTRERLASQLGREPSEQELVAEAGIPLEQVQLLTAMILPEVRLDSAAFQSDGPTHGELLGADEAPDAVDLLQISETSDLLQGALLKLQPRDAKILRLYYGFGDNREHTLEEIGGMIGLTRERVRQLRDRALAQLHGDFRLYRAFAGPRPPPEAVVRERQRNRRSVAA
jgi:RNA polymerase primary sigma factor